MNVATLKTVCYLGSLGLLGGIGFKAYKFFTEESPKLRQPFVTSQETTALLSSVTPTAAPKRVGPDYANSVKPSIWDFDWTGAPPVIKPTVDPDAEAVKVAPTVKPVTDIVSVTAAIQDTKGSGSKSFALLNFLETGATLKEEYFYVGDSLPAPNDNIALFAIRDGGVEFSFADEEREHEFLIPMKKAEDRVIVEADSLKALEDFRRGIDLRTQSVIAPGVANTNARPLKSEKRNGIWEFGTDDATQFQTGYQDIISEVGFQTYRDPVTGKKAGLQVTNVPSGSFAARHGAQQGDVVISINGTAVESEQQAIQQVHRSADEGETTWRVRILRLGREIEEVYNSSDN